jgi:hypothetical protein
VYIRHHRQVFEDERQLRRLEQLLAGLGFDRHALGPELDRLALGGLENLR